MQSLRQRTKTPETKKSHTLSIFHKPKDTSKEKKAIEDQLQTFLPIKTSGAELRKLANLVHPITSQNPDQFAAIQSEHKENFAKIAEKPEIVSNFFEKLFRLSYTPSTSSFDFLTQMGSLLASSSPLTSIFLGLLPQAAGLVKLNINPGIPVNGTDLCKNVTEACTQGFLTSDISNQSLTEFSRTFVNSTGPNIDMTSPVFLKLNECANLTKVGEILSDIYLKGSSQTRTIVESISHPQDALDMSINATNIPSDVAEQLKNAFGSLCIEKVEEGMSLGAKIGLGILWTAVGIAGACFLCCALADCAKRSRSNSCDVSVRCC